MRKTLTFALACCLTPASLCPFAQAQSIPAGVGSVPNIGFQLPQLGGSFNYSLNVSELISTGFYNSGTGYTTNISGDAAYLSGSTTHPFSAIYSGGYLAANSGQPNTTYQGLALSQGYQTKNWNFQIQDAVSYLPESPVTGLSGIPGVGDLGIDPVPLGPDAGIGILTDYGQRVSNTVTGSASRLFGRHWSAEASGYEDIQRFIGTNAQYGIDNSGEGGTGGVSYHFGTRSILTANYNYSLFNFVGTSYSVTTQSETVDYNRRWTRLFSTDFYAGPQHISSTGPFSGPATTQIAAGASASYNGRNAFYTLSYSRGANNGSGVIEGSFSDNVILAAHRQFGRQWSASGSVSYSRTTSLPELELLTYTGDAVSFGVQGVRALGRKLAAYASYTIEDQSTGGTTLPADAFSGFYQVFGIGVSYSPGSLFLSK